MTLFTSSRVRAAILLAGSVSFLAWAQSKIPADLDPQSRARLPWLKKSEVDAKRQKLFEAGIDASVIDVVRNNRPLDGLNEKTPPLSVSGGSCSATEKSIPRLSES